MTPDEIGPFLIRAAATDIRILPTDEAEATATTALWAVAMADIPFEFAVNAIAVHYAKSPYQVRPSDITDLWKAHIRQTAGQPDPIPDTGDPVEYRRQLAANRRAAHREPVTASAAIAAISGRPAPARGVPDLTEDDVRALRQQQDLARMLKDGNTRAKAECERRKRLVLGYPDLAEELTKPPLAYARPDCWNGGLGTDQIQDGRPNRSPSYRQLAAICAEAERRAANSARTAA
ncbi:hypothetical protein KV557_10135 [Kitasatospora aureofaciens]|uniref:hypothetical protein n=1 Tax=Kitasatospora aureofaciens TaxID=1894 RepID=UPI001C466231|nr:hypothetical protein [Kitasatospora aureofaciens]MBV6697483.1 hypothetical protein [Kitasatospora aureofaciens]